MTELYPANIFLPQGKYKPEEIIGLLPVAAYICNMDGYIIFFNKAAADLWGRKPEPGKDKWCGSWKSYYKDGSPLPPDQSPMAVAIQQRGPVQGLQTIIEQPNGTQYHILHYPELLVDESGRMTGAINTLINITDTIIVEKTKRQAEELARKNEELAKSEQRYHGMIDEVKDYAILLLSKEGIIENWNQGAQKIKGYTAEEIVGKSFSIFYTAEDRENGLPGFLIKEASDKGRAFHEGWRVKKDGTLFWGSITITALHDEEDNVTGFTKVTRDLTERKKAEKQLESHARLMEEKNRQLEKVNRELSSFVYIASHDLQEPLRKIQTLSSYLTEFETDQLSDKGLLFLKRMTITANQMKELIKDLLAYTQMSMDQAIWETVDLNTTLQQTIEIFSEKIEEKNAVLEPCSLPQIRAIPFQLQQLFNNLLSNALKYARKDTTPRIVIKADYVKGSDISHPDAVNNILYTHIQFSDNGIGFEPAYNEQIFRIFQRLHGKGEYSGTGIGLAICKKVIDNHHGIITAEGHPGEGATFHIYLPV